MGRLGNFARQYFIDRKLRAFRALKFRPSIGFKAAFDA
jgi:hypothetical protein